MSIALVSISLWIFFSLITIILQVNMAKKNPKVELIATKVNIDDGVSQILFADDVVVGPKTGHVYFSDATDIPPFRQEEDQLWDVLYSYKLDFLRGKRTGRLLRYNPKSDKVDVLVSDLWFANGIAVDKEETFIMISETSAARTLKYHLTGTKEGTTEIMVDQLPGVVDGACCNHEMSKLCYAAIPTPTTPLINFIFSLSPVIEVHLRTLMMMLPKSLSPKPVPYGGVVEISPGNDASYTSHHISRIFQDPMGENIKFITGVTVHKNKLYLASLTNDFIGVYDL